MVFRILRKTGIDEKIGYASHSPGGHENKKTSPDNLDEPVDPLEEDPYFETVMEEIYPVGKRLYFCKNPANCFYDPFSHYYPHKTASPQNHKVGKETAHQIFESIL